jgi:hypothetical protein
MGGWLTDRHPVSPLLAASQARDDFIGETVGVGGELAATRKMGQGAELAINGGVKTPDNQVIGVIGRDAGETLSGGL